jgi:NAD(P)-dependent dehydrogenase (short-subunit alcohol dehydrogenase family)
MPQTKVGAFILPSVARIAEPAELEAIDEVHFNRQFATNVKSVLFGSQAAARIFGDQGGSIINISSINARAPGPGYAIYSATKAAVEAITVALARELGPRGVRVNAVAPGTTLTDMTRRVLTESLEAAAVSAPAPAPLPVGETGGSRCQGEPSGGGSPTQRGRSKSGSAQARATPSEVCRIERSAEDRGYRSGRRRRCRRCTLVRARGGAH